MSYQWLLKIESFCNVCIYNIENINVNNSKYQSKLIAAQNSSKMYKNFMNSKPAQISDSVS